MSKTIELNIPETAAERIAAEGTLTGRLHKAASGNWSGSLEHIPRLMREAAEEIEGLQAQVLGLKQLSEAQSRIAKAERDGK